MTELLVSRSDFDMYRPLPASLDFAREIEPCIFLAQRGWLRDFFGSAQYRQLWQNPATAQNIALLSGGVYTDEEGEKDYFGLVPAIVLYSYALYIARNDMKITNAGNRRKKVAESEGASEALIATQKAQAMAEAQGYLEEARAFIRANSTDYPLAKLAMARGAVKVGMARKGSFYSEEN